MYGMEGGHLEPAPLQMGRHRVSRASQSSRRCKTRIPETPVNCIYSWPGILPPEPNTPPSLKTLETPQEKPTGGQGQTEDVALLPLFRDKVVV